MLFDLLFNIYQEFLGGGIDAVAEHEIIKEHDTLSRCVLKEFIGLVLPSSPDSDHVEVGVYGCVDQGLDGVAGFVVGIL